MAEPRASTEHENAPLLDRQEDDEERNGGDHIIPRPSDLTKREQGLSIIVLVLLAIAAIFVGLFAGAEHALKKERREHHPGSNPTATVTATPAPGPTGKPGNGAVCTTSDCVTVAADIIRSMNESADPCDDFYEFANGGWLDTNSIPEDRGLYGSFHEVADGNKKKLLKIIEAIDIQADDEKLSPEEANLKKLKATYSSCMDVDAIDHKGAKPFLQLVKEVTKHMGSFDKASTSESLTDDAWWRGAYTEDYVVPEELRTATPSLRAMRDAYRHLHRVTPNVDKDDHYLSTTKDTPVDPKRRKRITDTVAFLHSRGVDALFNFMIEGDSGGEDSQVQALYFYQSFGGLPAKQYYDEAPIVDLYQSVIADVLTDVVEAQSNRNVKRDFVADVIGDVVEEGWPWPWPGSDDEEKEPEQEPLGKRMDKLAEQVVHLERNIVFAGADLEYLFNPHYAYNPYDWMHFPQTLPWLDLGAYLSSTNTRKYPTQVVVTYPPYLKRIAKIIDETPDHVLSAYFVTKLALTYGDYLGPKVSVRKDVRRLSDTLKGVKPGTEENRSDMCLAVVDDLVGFIAGREFVRIAFSPEAKADGEHIINSIVDAFYNKLPHIEWMDKESAKAAQKKAKNIIPKVGYPLSPNTTDPSSLQRWYSRLAIKENAFFDNMVEGALLDGQRMWGSLGKKRDRNTWGMVPQMVNAYYSPPDGEIVFPAGILQPPFYSYEWPAHLKYGAFGAVAAHELTHAFDNSGAQYDEHGRLRDWWTNKTVEAFQERAQCVARQYSKYFVLDDKGNKVYVNGNLTNGEDIADSGLAQAYAAWRADVDADKNEPALLPGLDYTADQLFFIAYARIWATLVRPATAVERIRTDPHSPPYWRTIGTLRDNDAFHKAFKCKSGSPMNPPKKQQCELW